MLTIPRAVLPVVRVLRRDVPKPSAKSLVLVQCGTRWPDNNCCPLGLHPKATHCTPVRTSDFNDIRLSFDAIVSFAGWWDSLTLADARRAVDLIWPRKRGG